MQPDPLYITPPGKPKWDRNQAPPIAADNSSHKGFKLLNLILFVISKIFSKEIGSGNSPMFINKKTVLRDMPVKWSLS